MHIEPRHAKGQSKQIDKFVSKLGFASPALASKTLTKALQACGQTLEDVLPLSSKNIIVPAGGLVDTGPVLQGMVMESVPTMPHLAKLRGELVTLEKTLAKAGLRLPSSQAILSSEGVAKAIKANHFYRAKVNVLPWRDAATGRTVLIVQFPIRNAKGEKATKTTKYEPSLPAALEAEKSGQEDKLHASEKFSLRDCLETADGVDTDNGTKRLEFNVVVLGELDMSKAMGKSHGPEM